MMQPGCTSVMHNQVNCSEAGVPFPTWCPTCIQSIERLSRRAEVYRLRGLSGLSAQLNETLASLVPAGSALRRLYLDRAISARQR